MRHALERNALHAREALVVGRGLELAEARICCVGARSPGSERAAFFSSSGREVAESVEQAFDHVDLCLRERRIDPDAARGDAEAGTVSTT
jgi:hypothetical protein